MRVNSDENVSKRPAMTGHIKYHQWGSLVNWGSTQVNSTGVPWALDWGLYMYGYMHTDHAMLQVVTNGK